MLRRCLTAHLQGLWTEFEEGTVLTINKRFVKMFFINDDTELEEKEVVDGSIPYETITVETGERFEVMSNDVVSHVTRWGTAHWGAKDARRIPERVG